MSMDFIDQVKQFAKRVESLKDSVATEEATKTAIIMPFFSLLGYDVFNPEEFVPEYTADVGIKKGEKVDYAIMQDGKPSILIEAKWIGEPLERHDSQLFRYFGTTKAKFAILTNGMVYRFYTDLDEVNKMDEKPFLDINILDIKEGQVSELRKFCKSSFDLNLILDTASELKYSNAFRTVFADELQNPSEDLVRIFLSGTYTSLKTQTVIDKFRPIVKKTMANYMSEMMNDKIKSVLDTGSQGQPAQPQAEEPVADAGPAHKIETTAEEMGAYILIQNLLKGEADPADITSKDTVSYFNVLYKNNSRKWICRLVLNSSQKALVLPDENKNDVKYVLGNIFDIEQYKEQLIAVLKRYL